MAEMNSLLKVIDLIHEVAATEDKLAIAVVGKSASGKDTVAHTLATQFNGIVDVTCATRAKREGETNGKEHIFMSNETFNELKDAGSFAALHSYINEEGRLVQFGTLKPDFEEYKIHFIVLDEGGAEHLKTDGAANGYCVKTLKVIADYEKRKARMMKRGGMALELFELREKVNAGIDNYETDWYLDNNQGTRRRRRKTFAVKSIPPTHEKGTLI